MEIFYAPTMENVRFSNKVGNQIEEFCHGDFKKAREIVQATYARGLKHGFGRLAQWYRLKSDLLLEWEKAAADRKMIDDVETSLFDTADAAQPKPNTQPLIDAMKIFNAANIKEE